MSARLAHSFPDWWLDSRFRCSFGTRDDVDSRSRRHRRERARSASRSFSEKEREGHILPTLFSGHAEKKEEERGREWPMIIEERVGA